MDGLDQYEVENLVNAAKAELEAEINDLRYQIGNLRSDVYDRVEIDDLKSYLKREIEDLKDRVTSLAERSLL